jgi:hypothetical protein
MGGWGSRGLEEAEGAFFFEVEGAAGGGRYAAEAAAEVGDRRAYGWLGQHTKAEGQGRWTDVVALLQLERRGHRGDVRLGELPVQRPMRAMRPIRPM